MSGATRSHFPLRRCLINDVATEPSDDELVHRTLAGEHDAFAALVRRHRRAALARALGVLGDPADADDIAQEAFVHAFESSPPADTPIDSPPGCSRSSNGGRSTGCERSAGGDSSLSMSKFQPHAATHRSGHWSAPTCAPVCSRHSRGSPRFSVRSCCLRTSSTGRTTALPRPRASPSSCPAAICPMRDVVFAISFPLRTIDPRSLHAR